MGGRKHPLLESPPAKFLFWNVACHKGLIDWLENPKYFFLWELYACSWFQPQQQSGNQNIANTFLQISNIRSKENCNLSRSYQQEHIIALRGTLKKTKTVYLKTLSK